MATVAIIHNVVNNHSAVFANLVLVQCREIGVKMNTPSSFWGAVPLLSFPFLSWTLPPKSASYGPDPTKNS